MIELKDIRFEYRETKALNGICLKIEDGEAVALIGPNGSGKSTLLKLLNGIYTPQSGEYYFDGELIHEKRMKNPLLSKQFHKRIGFVFQNSDAQLFCSNVYEEIAFGPRQMGFSQEETDNRVKDCLEMLSIEHLKHREPYHLSEGEKKKTAIAAVLALNPEVLTMDEPFDGLDPRTKRFLRDFLIRFREAGKTIVCATHEYEYIKGIFNRIVVISEDHKIIRDGSPEEILADSDFLEHNNLK